MAWHRTFDVFSIRRLLLRDLGCTEEQINLLTDDNLQAIAGTLRENLHYAAGMDFNEEVRFVTCVFFADDGLDI